ncbi:MAG: TniB family NTP-binding protein [Holophaga sp.]|nr:TniB family NTP-binding protein [Holophaga sp.]
MNTASDSNSSSNRLHHSAEAMLGASAQDRIQFLEVPFWLNYPAAEAILQRLDRITLRLVGRPEGLLIVGDPNNGKTHLLDYYLRKNPPVMNPDGTGMTIPVVFIQAPVGAGRKDLFQSLCEGVRIPDLVRGEISWVRHRVNLPFRERQV